MKIKRLTASVVVTAFMLGAPLAVRAAALVPGGNGLIVFAGDRTGQQELYTAKPDGTDVTQLTHSAAGLQTDHPAWSPDGEWIVFNRDNDAGVDLWIIDRAGHHEHQLTHLDGVSAEPAWAPDGSRIVFQHFTGDALQDLYTIRPDGTDLVRITNTPSVDEVLASFSPDGASLAYGSITYSGSDAFAHVRVSRSDGTGARTITADAINGGRPGWSPDGRHIVFSNNTDTGVEQSLYTIDPDGSNLHRLTTAPAGAAGDTFAAYSPNGRSITFTSDRTGTTGIWVMRADGTEMHDITPSTSGAFDSDWRTR